jgi:hypothetical protein
MSDETPTAREKLKAAMAKYGFTDADRVHWPGHIADADANGCWCGAAIVCATCGLAEPCIHGPGRGTQLAHKRHS